jgi:hypothetical protein
VIFTPQIRTTVLNAALDHVNGEGLFTRDLVAEFEMTLSELIGSVPCPAEPSHDFEAMNAASSVDLWACPFCGAAV